MTVRRTYLPLDGAALRRLGEVAELSGPVRGYAVTREVSAALPEADEEEREYDALIECATAASGLGRGRRVIASADLDERAVTDVPDGYAAVQVTGPVPLGRIVSFHVDETAEHSDEDLLWYDVSELPEVLRLAAEG